MDVFDSTTWDEASHDLLLSAVEACTARLQTKAVLADLLTEKEINELSRRLVVAQLLESGENYIFIQNHLGVSTATIAEVSKKLKYGSGGYQLVLRLIKERQTKPGLAILADNDAA